MGFVICYAYQTSGQVRKQCTRDANSTLEQRTG